MATHARGPVISQKLITPWTNKELLDAYCEHLCSGMNQKQAYIAASPDTRKDNKESINTACEYHKRNREYIQAYIHDKITDKAPLALSVITQIMLDTNEKGGIRLKAAQDILDRAGYNSKTRIELTTKEVNEMSTSDLKQEIQKLLAETGDLIDIQ